MALDGIMFEGVAVRVRRPNDYNPAAAAMLGPSTPSPALNLAAIGLGADKGGSSASAAGHVNPNQDPDRIFIGGLPYYLNDDQCRELLGSFGELLVFDLVKDKDTFQSKGYGFAIFQDRSVTDIAIAGLNGLQMGDRTLAVRRANEGPPPKDQMVPVPLPPLQTLPSLAGASRIVVLKNAVEVEELSSPSDYEEIMQDMQEEAAKYGAVLKINIPRPEEGNPAPNGLGLVIIEYTDITAAVKAKTAMHGRKFGGHTVVGTFLQEADYALGNFAASQ